MRHPDRTWALRILTVDILADTDPDHPGEITLLAGAWLPDQPPPALHDGDLIVQLTPADPTTPGQHAIDVEMLLADRDRWHYIAHWRGVDQHWPHCVAHTAAAVLNLHSRASAPHLQHDTTQPLSRWATGTLDTLLDTGLIKPDDELIWDRRDGQARHTAHIRPDGTLIIADGRVYTHPSHATTALAGHYQDGWSTWRRTSDHRTLEALRSQLLTRQRTRRRTTTRH